MWKVAAKDPTRQEPSKPRTHRQCRAFVMAYMAANSVRWEAVWRSKGRRNSKNDGALASFQDYVTEQLAQDLVWSYRAASPARSAQESRLGCDKEQGCAAFESGRCWEAARVYFDDHHFQLRTGVEEDHLMRRHTLVEVRATLFRFL